MTHMHYDLHVSLGCVDSQIWHMLRPIGLTGRPDQSDRSGSAYAKFGCQQDALCSVIVFSNSYMYQSIQRLEYA